MAEHAVHLPGLRVHVTGPARLLADLPRLFPERAAPRQATEQAVAHGRVNVARAADGTYRLERDGALVRAGAQRDEVFPLLEWTLATAAVEQFGRDHVLFHAGAVAQAGAGVLLPGEPGSGKTTLVAGLVADGWAFYSDEVAVVDPRTLRLHPFVRGLCIKSGALPVLRQRFPEMARWRTRRRFGEERVAYLAPPAPAWGVAAVPVRHVVFPRYRADAATGLSPLGRAAALGRLMAQSFTGTRHGAAGLERTVALLRGAACWDLLNGSLDEAVQALAPLAPAT